MDVEIRPEPGREEREAILVALEKLLAEDALPPAYRSGWRAEAIRENVSEAEGADGASGRPPRRAGATRA